MTAELDELARFEAELTDDSHELVCPVCRLAQPYDTLSCGRCGADLALLANTLREAHERKRLLYRSLLEGDAVGALTQIEKLVQLTGPKLELAALRRVVRGGLVPIEVVDALREEADDLPEDDPAAAYREPAATNPLRPPIDSAREPFAALLEAAEPLEPVAATAPCDERDLETVVAAHSDLEPEPDVEVTVTTSEADAEPEAAPVDVAISVSSAPGVAPPRAIGPDHLALALRVLPVLQRFGWLILIVVVLALMAAGYGLGTLIFGR